MTINHSFKAPLLEDILWIAFLCLQIRDRQLAHVDFSLHSHSGCARAFVWNMVEGEPDNRQFLIISGEIQLVHDHERTIETHKREAQVIAEKLENLLVSGTPQIKTRQDMQCYHAEMEQARDRFGGVS